MYFGGFFRNQKVLNEFLSNVGRDDGMKSFKSKIKAGDINILFPKLNWLTIKRDFDMAMFDLMNSVHKLRWFSITDPTFYWKKSSKVTRFMNALELALQVINM